ncbi:uncharacterized protein I206_106785 [Kwoniella pini CBS 10737]|uniref:Uncharacterized protein n=1 Tax=Kwoniella pini CBS 10737 TaxID=1296096 RepID=A0A1B9HT82_9TREE|nr:uncharacterized protein I206_07328 [Kwoniella pini CBS 10737]OCF46475.1 hypothetical protein I206_07328 [Kwoniella pini CBS 10737]
MTLTIPARLLRHRGLSVKIHSIRYNHSQSGIDPIEWLPLPRSLAYRKALMLLSLPIPPKHWPSHLEMNSSLLAASSAHLKSKGIAVNAIYDGTGTETTFQKEESCKARIFWPDGRIKTYDQYSMNSISSDELLLDLEYTPISLNVGSKQDIKEILVCTHGSRDCRCSDRGGPLVQALKEEVERRGVGDKVKINEIAHVGGHKYAANAILLPSLDMMSNLTVEHAPSLISHLLHPKNDSKMWNHWRGRYGLTEDQQAEIWSTFDASRSKDPTTNKSDVVPDQETVELRFKTYEGELRVVNARLGSNLLEVGKENDLPSLEGVCGGNLECATCHLYIPSKPSIPPIGEASEEEFDMLGYALGYRDGESRLGCQVRVTKELAEWSKKGGVIGLPRF